MQEIIISVVQTSGLGVFIYFLFRGLTTKIKTLNEVIKVQSETLKVMDWRIEETEKVGLIYKKLIQDLPGDLDNYRTIINKTKDQVILELTNQKEETEKKLEKARIAIQNSGDSDALITKHLNILKILLGKHNLDEVANSEFDLKTLSTYNKRIIEKSVKEIVNSATVEEFLKRINYTIEIGTDEQVINNVVKTRMDPNGQELVNFIASSSIFTEWYGVFNNHIYIHEKRLSRLKDEFSILKSQSA